MILKPNENLENLQGLSDLTGYSPFMIKAMQLNYGDEYRVAMNAFDRIPIHSIRVNTLRITPEKLKGRLEEKGFKIKQAEWFPFALHVDGEDALVKLGATHEYLKGLYYNQSLASMVPVYTLFPLPGDQVLDMCAAPGSKTTQIGQMMENNGEIIAIDVKPSRIKSLVHNLRRCGINNASVFIQDSSVLKVPFGGGFTPNKILLDAPCSGSGILRNDPTGKRRKNDAEIQILADRQRKLLKRGLDLLSPGGVLVYSTCSFHYQENEQVVADVVLNRKDCEIIEPDHQIGFPGLDHAEGIEFGYEMLKTRRISPHHHDTDAFFICKIRKLDH